MLRSTPATAFTLSPASVLRTLSNGPCTWDASGDDYWLTPRRHIDGHDYFWALSEMLDSAKECIFILVRDLRILISYVILMSHLLQDWWLTPELYLRRPPAYHEEWRLDRILKRKAEQGVKIYVVVYKEVRARSVGQARNVIGISRQGHANDEYELFAHEGTGYFEDKAGLVDLISDVESSRSAASQHRRHAPPGPHRLQRCVLFPPRWCPVNVPVPTDDVEFWSHHEKVVVVDNHRACIGGLDICFGRWDTNNHPLADAHPTDFSRTLFPGQDYNNARIIDFQDVYNYVSGTIDITESPRMPWHDVHMTLVGPVVLDIVQHFTERWNEIKKRKVCPPLQSFDTS